MAEIINDKLGVSFTLPDNPSVSQILLFDSKMSELLGQPLFLKAWELAKVVVTDWKCELFPDMKIPLDKIEGDEKNIHNIARVIEFTGIQTISWRMNLDSVSKN